MGYTFEMKTIIYDTLNIAIKQLYGFSSVEDVSFDVLTPPRSEFGDYSTNISMILAKRLRRNPMDIAKEIVGAFGENAFCDRIEIISPGYINIFLAHTFLCQRINTIVKNNHPYETDNRQKKSKNILIEFISSNPTGPIHLGNARGGPSGDTLARVLEKMGHRVWREFYVNDCGKQIEVLGHSVLKDEESQYAGSYIESLSQEKPEEIQDPYEVGMWASQQILETHIQPTCDKLDITFDAFFSEKSLHNDGSVQDMLEILRRKNFVYEKENALWYRSTNLGDDKDRVIIRSNGKPTYRLADFAYHKNKIDRGFDTLITFLGADHLGEAKEMQAFMDTVLEKSGVYFPVLTQFVRVLREGKEVKMSKRQGTYYAMDDLIEEVGRDAVRFIFLSYDANSHITFDIDLAKEKSEKNPVYYVQYAHARIESIFEKSGALSDGAGNVELLSHTKERELMVMLLRFTDLMEMIGENYEVHRLPHYARSVADTFHSLYASCRFIDTQNEDLSRARLILARATKIVLAQTLYLCGVSAPSKM